MNTSFLWIKNYSHKSHTCHITRLCTRHSHVNQFPDINRQANRFQYQQRHQLTFSSVHDKKCWKTSDWATTGCRHILSIHCCSCLIRSFIKSSSYRPKRKQGVIIPLNSSTLSKPYDWTSAIKPYWFQPDCSSHIFLPKSYKPSFL